MDPELIQKHAAEENRLMKEIASSYPVFKPMPPSTAASPYFDAEQRIKQAGLDKPYILCLMDRTSRHLAWAVWFPNSYELAQRVLNYTYSIGGSLHENAVTAYRRWIPYFPDDKLVDIHPWEFLNAISGFHFEWKAYACHSTSRSEYYDGTFEDIFAALSGPAPAPVMGTFDGKPLELTDWNIRWMHELASGAGLGLVVKGKRKQHYMTYFLPSPGNLDVSLPSTPPDTPPPQHSDLQVSDNEPYDAFKAFTAPNPETISMGLLDPAAGSEDSPEFLCTEANIAMYRYRTGSTMPTRQIVSAVRQTRMAILGNPIVDKRQLADTVVKFLSSKGSPIPAWLQKLTPIVPQPSAQVPARSAGPAKTAGRIIKRTHKCPFCISTFSTDSNRQAHIQSKHADKLATAAQSAAGPSSGN